MSTTLPDSPMMLDSTGRTIVQKLQGIIDALGGGGGGDMVMPPEYDPELEDSTKGYFRGQYVTYNDSLYKCKVFINVYEGHPAGPFDATKFDEITDLFNEFFQLKPGVISDLKNTNEIFNDYINNTVSSGSQFGHAEGLRTTASNTSHAEGMDTVTTGSYCHAEGGNTNAGGPSQNSGCHAEGYYTQATGNNSHSEGNSTTASGNYSHAEGSNSQATGPASHAEGYNTRATGDYSHAEGYNSKATNTYAHAEGYNTTASQMASHAEGNNSTASGNYSHAEGNNTTASGYYAHAEGSGSQAIGNVSHAGGYYTVANNNYETAIGIYNESTSGSDVIFSIGNGDDDTSRSNAFEVKIDGTAKLGNKQVIAINPPATDGTYTLQCTVSNGVATYAWV